MRLRRQLPAWSPISFAALRAGLRAGLSGADAREALSARIRTVYGCAEVVLTDSGTSALALAFRAAAGAAKPIRVALPAYGCFDLMTAADAVAADVVLYDLDPTTLAPDLESLRAALRQGPQAVVVAHWWGVPVDVEVIRGSVGAAGAVLIEDAAQGVGGSVGGRPLGSLGDLAVLSFGRGKGRPGGGGALLFHAPDLGSRAEAAVGSLTHSRGGFGRLVALGAEWAFGRPSLFWVPASLPFLRLGETIYHSPWAAGKMPEVSATLVGELWAASEREAHHRGESGNRWSTELATLPSVRCFFAGPEERAGWLRFPVIALTGILSYLRSPKAIRRGVMPGYPRTLAGLGRPLAGGTTRFPGAESLADFLVTLPTHSRVTEADRRVILGGLGLAD